MENEVDTLTQVEDEHKTYQCRHCGEVEAWVRLRPDTPHYGELCCKQCNAHIGWIPKPKNKVKLEKRPKKIKAEDLGIDLCQFCGTPKESLGPHQTLDVHHIDDDPCNNERINLTVYCTKCHKLCHHERKWNRYSRYAGNMADE